MRLFAKIGITLLALYLAFFGFVYWLMHQPPERLAAGMGKMPMPLYLIIPFETFWFSARAGQVNVGDAAPDFNLPTVDKSAQVQLASFRGAKPVVLIFGSYT